MASILHQETIRRLSGDGAFDRGKKYFDEGRVTNVERKEGSVHAKVRGTEESPYAVRIWMKDESLAYACSCPMGQDQAFCKHAVAVALASVAGLTDVVAARRETPQADRDPPLPLAKAKADPLIEPPRPADLPRPQAPARPTPPPAAPSAPAKPATRPPPSSLADALRALSHEELVVMMLEAALDHETFRAHLVERLRRR